MPRSSAFIRIKGEVLGIVSAIPAGRVTTHTIIGRLIEVNARHVAYILATLDPAERAGVAWHRVVSSAGGMGTTNPARAAEQAARLASEGLTIDAQGMVEGFETLLWLPD